MVEILLASTASGIGASIGGAVGSAVGYGVGSIIGSQIDNRILNGKSSYKMQGSHLADLTVQTCTYGKTIPILYGTCRIAGNIIWSLPIKEHIHNHSSGGGKFRPSVTYTNYNYTVSLALGLCEGYIDSIGRVWADNRIINPKLGKYRLYYGKEDQLPDPLIEAHEGKGNTPAYRGLAYIVIEDFPLEDFGNRIPNFTFEVTRKLKNIAQTEDVENIISSVCIIPGSGEFVYDTKIQNKYLTYKDENKTIRKGKLYPINNNNFENKADALVSLDQMQNALPNLKWCAPVVTWFADSLNAKYCQIMPRVEYKDNAKTEPDMWNVGKYNRDSAICITKDENNSPIYGGTISDSSIVRYITEIRSRNLRIMFYPMFFLDIKGKPWRGKVSGEADDIRDFFTRNNGYNQFILHYAHLMKGKVDAFVIGSELVGLTKVKDSNNNYPAVDQLVELAKEVKNILGNGVIVTYAADWSEYHHTEGGWYNLDKLWSCPYIDVIGIDAYFPLTDSVINKYDEEEVIKNWESGEGFDFYYKDEDRTEKCELSPSYAWKNIYWWWSNQHINPDGRVTSWQPKSKKIWFCEYGFPSVDCATNQPNLFYSKDSIDSALPRFSRGKVDFRAQRLGLLATEKKWNKSEMVQNKFVWCWDARPYPYWPDMNHIWTDGLSWSRGHWLNGKLGLCSIASVITELTLKAGLKIKHINTSLLQEFVDGYVLASQVTVREAIENLQRIFFFDVVETNKYVSFIQRGNKESIKISHKDLVLKSDKDSIIISRMQENMLPRYCEILYLNKINEYQLSTESAERIAINSCNKTSISIPMVLGSQHAKITVEKMIMNFWIEQNSYKFWLPPQYIYLEPTDLLSLEFNNKIHNLRIIKTTLISSRVIEIEAVTEDETIYDINIDEQEKKSIKLENFATQIDLHVLDIPILPWDKNNNELFVYIAACDLYNNWRYVQIFIDNVYYDSIKYQATIGSIINEINISSEYLFDNMNIIRISLIEGELFSVTEEEVLNHANYALIGEEIIQFTNAKLIEDHVYEISGILRGKLGTKITKHYANEKFILLNNKLSKIIISPEKLNQEILIKYLPIGVNDDEIQERKFIFHGNSLKELAPIEINVTSDNINWIERRLYDCHLRDYSDIISHDNYLLQLFNKSEVIISLLVNKTNINSNEYKNFFSFLVKANILKISVLSNKNIKGHSAEREIAKL